MPQQLVKDDEVLELEAVGQEVEIGLELVMSRRGLPLGALRALPALLSARDAFDVMGISRSTGYELVREGLVPSVELGGRRWVRTVELAEQVFGIRPEDLLGSREAAAE